MNSSSGLEQLNGLAVTVMGLGLNGGGVETCRFLSRHGARVTATDLRDAEVLKESLDRLAGLDIRFVLGRHEMEDFSQADLVIKNPAVRPNNPYIAASRRVETDLSLFLNHIGNRVIGVTGSKGKSTTATAIHHGLKAHDPRARLGGNITISPLSFFQDLQEGDPLVLELSSFQLGDLARSHSYRAQGRLRSFPPHIAVMTSIFHDHQDYYGSMERYLADKEMIFADQHPEDWLIYRSDCPWGVQFARKARGRLLGVTASTGGVPTEASAAWFDEAGEGWVRIDGEAWRVLPSRLRILGTHHKANLLQAAAALRIHGVPSETIYQALGEFGGVEHRLEVCATCEDRIFVNDSAATIPEAAEAAVASVDQPVHLICGGNNKELDFSPFINITTSAASIHLLRGTGTDIIMKVLGERGLGYQGPYDGIETALDSAWKASAPGSMVMLSPGCTSFGMFANEFDRGRKFKAAVERLVSLRANP